MYFFPVEEPYNTARLVRFFRLKLFCMCTCQVGKGRVNWCHYKALLNRGSDHRKTLGFLNGLAMDNTYYTLCAQHTSALSPRPVREMREGVSVRP